MEPNRREFIKQCAFQKFCNTVLHNEACDAHKELHRHILAVLVFCIELAHTSPMGRAVFFTGAAVSLIELVAVNSQWINDKHRQQKFRSIWTPVQCGRVLY